MATLEPYMIAGKPPAMCGPTTAGELIRLLYSRGLRCAPGTQVRRKPGGWYHAEVVQRDTGEGMGQRWIKYNGLDCEGPRWTVSKTKP
jgi:hypothetical protein